MVSTRSGRSRDARGRTRACSRARPSGLGRAAPACAVARLLRVALVVASLCLVARPGVAAPGDRHFPEPVGYVNDLAGVLDPAMRDRLETVLSQADERFEVQIAIVTLRDIGDDDPTEYANLLYEAWGIGNRKTDRGVLVMDLIRGAGRNFYRIEVGYGLEGLLPDARVARIRDGALAYLREAESDPAQRGLAYAATARGLLLPIVEERGEDPAQVDELLSGSGFSVRSGRGGSGRAIPIPVIIVFIVLMLLLSNRRRGRGVYVGGPFGPFGGFGGFGGSGGGGGGFGGFGGGMSGGGGAGGSY